MRTWVGYGPKRFASIVRFQETLSRLEDAPGRSAATLATETGFFDQAHLTTEQFLDTLDANLKQKTGSW